jgi:DNA mismatch endonuclease (patch repair protein)
MGRHSKLVRSYNMSQIKSKNTKPEEAVRKYLFSCGFRYRKNVRSLPGCPDIVLPKYKTVIFVNGCFWHMHTACGRFVWPKDNAEYWHAKIMKNVERDNKNHAELKTMGWNVIVIWECELKGNSAHDRLRALVFQVTKQITVL